jgi:hypothetical protein
MTDIEQLRSNVINAARDVASTDRPTMGQLANLGGAVDALDAAEKPCPWKALRDALDITYSEHSHSAYEQLVRLQDAVEAALAWHDQQEADACPSCGESMQDRGQWLACLECGDAIGDIPECDNPYGTCYNSKHHQAACSLHGQPYIEAKISEADA